MTKKLDKLLGEPSKEPAPSGSPAASSPSAKSAKKKPAAKKEAPPADELRDKMTPKEKINEPAQKSLWNPGSW